MKEKIAKLITLFEERLFLYPVLTGILYIIYELYKNRETVGTKNMILFSLVVLIFCEIIILVANLIIKDKIKASLVATLFIVFNLYYQSLVSTLN